MRNNKKMQKTDLQKYIVTNAQRMALLAICLVATLSGALLEAQGAFAETQQRGYESISPADFPAGKAAGLMPYPTADSDVTGLPDGIRMNVSLADTNGLVYLSITDAIHDGISEYYLSIFASGGSAEEHLVAYIGEGFYPIMKDGGGAYRIEIYKSNGDGMAAYVTGCDFTAQAFPEEEPYRWACANTPYGQDSELAGMARYLTFGLSSGEDKVTAVADFVLAHVEYENDWRGVGNLVDVDDVYSGGRGVCYHSAELACAMLRSVGIPARERRGYIVWDEITGEERYHSWGEAWVDGRWLPFDATSPLFNAAEFTPRPIAL